MINLADLNIKIAIAYALFLIAFLLVYIAFFKEPVEKTHSPRRSS